jgi:hypothetical protein
MAGLTYYTPVQNATHVLAIPKQGNSNGNNHRLDSRFDHGRWHRRHLRLVAGAFADSQRQLGVAMNNELASEGRKWRWAAIAIALSICATMILGRWIAPPYGDPYRYQYIKPKFSGSEVFDRKTGTITIVPYNRGFWDSPAQSGK